MKPGRERHFKPPRSGFPPMKMALHIVSAKNGMCGRELVRRASSFDGPERVPRDLPDPWGTDFYHVGIGGDPNWKPKAEGEDEWGCIWRKVSADDKTMGQVKVHPLDDYSKLDGFTFPNYDIPERYTHLPEQLAKNIHSKFMLIGIPLSLIHRLDYLRGNRNAVTDPYRNPGELKALLQRMTDIALVSLERIAPLGIDGIISCDDWGLQNRSLISPEIFRRFFKPFYKQVYNQAHKHGMVTLLHSCGHITELLDGMIEAELDVIQMDQQQNMGVENLAEQFGGRLCFWCPVDIQNAMVKGSLQDVQQYARKLIEYFGTYNGGFMCKWYGSPAAVGHSQDKINAMSQAFVRYGRYA